MRKFLAILLALVLATGCVGALAATKVKTTITLSQTGTLTLSLNETVQVTATVNPAAPVEWSTKKAAVAVVDANGRITAKGEGSTTIIAKAGGKTAKLKVKVVDPNKPTKIYFTAGKTANAKVGATLQLGTELEPKNAKATLTWKSSKPAIADVNANGVVTPKAEGKVKITVTTHNKKKATITVVVVDPNKPTGVKLAQGTARTMTTGQSLQLTAVPEPSTAKTSLTWKSSKPGVATVDASGKVTAVGKGKAKITVQAANYKKVKATITITVVQGEAPVDAKDLSAWLDKKASAAESALGLTRGTDKDNTGTHYKLSGSGYYMYISSADYATATINWVALQGAGKSNCNICGFHTSGMTYDQAIAKAKADKWSIDSDNDFGNFKALILKKNGKWLRVTASRSGEVNQVAYANAN